MSHKQIYEVGEVPPIGHVPEKMYAQVIRAERFGDPKHAFKIERIPVPEIKPDEVLVYVMAAGINFNNVWAALGSPVAVIAALGYVTYELWLANPWQVIIAAGPPAPRHGSHSAHLHPPPAGPRAGPPGAPAGGWPPRRRRRRGRRADSTAAGGGESAGWGGARR